MGIFEIQNYFLNPDATAPVFVATLAVIFGLFSYRLDERSVLHRALLYFSLSAALWLYAYSFLIASRSAPVAVFWSHFLYLGCALTAVTVYHISVAVSHEYQRQTGLLRILYILASALALLSWNPYFVEGVQRYYFGYYPVAGILQVFLVVFILVCFVLAFFNLIQYYRLIREAFERRKAGFFGLIFIVVLLTFTDLLRTYSFDIYPSSYLIFFGAMMSLIFFVIRCHEWVVDQRAQALESIIEEKTSEISKILEELRKTQIKIFETGRLSALASLSAGILHQISQPITAIHGFVRFLKKEMKPDNEFYRPISLMEEQTVYLKEMLEDLMGLVRHREIKKARINVNDFLQRALNLLSDEIRIKRVNYDTNLEKDLPKVYADGIHLQQVFMNVIINALQAMEGLPPARKRYLTITSRFDKTNNQVLVAFRDTGPGLSEEDKAQIFEPFFSTKEKGSGIGLALCKDLVAEHGGRIRVESEQDSGTEFVIQLPVDSTSGIEAAEREV